MVKIKTEPEDFRVEEAPSRIWKDVGKYVVYRATKRDMTTTELVQRLASRNGLPQRAIRYAGLKDKRAVTSQYITAPKELSAPEGIALEHAGFTDEPLHLGELEANRFTIVAREVKGVHDVAVPNYFGDQRFSEHNVELGLALLKKDYKTVAATITGQPVEDVSSALRALQHANQRILLLYLHAVQSWLWNRAVSAWVAEHGSMHTAKWRHGTLRFPKELPDLQVPLPGAAQPLGDWEQQYIPLLDEAGLRMQDFRITALPHLTQEGELRALRMDIRKKRLERDGDTVTVHLTLGPGCYATVCLAAWLS